MTLPRAVSRDELRVGGRRAVTLKFDDRAIGDKRRFPFLAYNEAVKGVVRESMAAYGGKLRPMSVREYYLAADKGVFKPGERLELIHGEVFQKVSPQKSPHAAVTEVVARTLRETFGAGFHARVQLPLRLDNYSEPEPDIAVAAGDAEDYMSRHPNARDVKLVVEVADTTLRFDRGAKSKLYASFGIEEYWIANLKNGNLEVFREPCPDGYGRSQIFGKGDEISPLNAPGKSIPVSTLIPI